MSEGDLSDHGFATLRAASATKSAATATANAPVPLSPTAATALTPNSKQRPVRRRLRRSTTVSATVMNVKLLLCSIFRIIFHGKSFLLLSKRNLDELKSKCLRQHSHRCVLRIKLLHFRQSKNTSYRMKRARVLRKTLQCLPTYSSVS